MNGTKSTDGDAVGAIPAALVVVVNHSPRTVLRRAVLFLAVASLAVASLIPLSAPAAPAGRVPERILVQPKDAAPEAALQAVFAGHGARQAGAIHQINVRILHVPEARLGRVLESLKHNPLIEFAEPDYLFAQAAVPNDTYYSLEWHLPKIAAPAAWDTTVGSSNVVIAVLDSGVDGTHPDLAAQLVAGWNFYDNNADTSDVNGHGTGVAGTAAALSNNGQGVASVAWVCKLMPIRVSDASGYASASAIASGLTWAADHGARVANLSFDNVSTVSSLSTAAQYFQSKGGVVVSAAGNDGLFDATADNPLFLKVSATDSTDTLASWSNTGNNVDVAAPGVTIATTMSGGGYGYGTGTSFSSPIVAGVAALVLSVNPNLTPGQVTAIIETTADDLGPVGWDPQYGYGRVNASRAVQAALSAGATDTTPPTAAILSPVSGMVVSNLVTINVSGTDNVGITRVECYLNGACVGTNSVAPATFTWDTTGYTNGSYSLQARAYDAAGNMGVSAMDTVTVQNAAPDTTPPTVQITAPTTGSSVVGAVSVNINGSDNVGVTRIEWYLDGALVGSSATAPASFSWNTTNSANGSHTLQAKAYDAAGNSSASATVTVTVQNAVADTTPPTAQVTSPTSGTTVASKTTKVYVTASDNVGVTRVDLLVDGKNYATSSSATPMFSWTTSKLSRGSHTLQAIAYDAAGNSTRSSVVTVYK